MTQQSSSNSVLYTFDETSYENYKNPQPVPCFWETLLKNNGGKIEGSLCQGKK